MPVRFPLVTMMSLLLLTLSTVSAAERHMMQPRVPADKLDEARAMKSPLPDSPEIVSNGKEIYEGKGTCFNCHGMTGRGDGPGGSTLNPSPRNFRHRRMWHHRTEGEIFWVIKNGIHGTGMIPFGGLLSDEEIWTVLQYERSFAGGRGHGGGRHKGMAGEGRKGRKGHGGRGQERSLQPTLQKGEKAAAAININQAIVAATQRVTGTVIEAEFEEEKDQAFWEIKIVSEDGKVMEVKVDSATGDVIATEEKKAEKKQKRKRKGKKGRHGDDHECCSKGEHNGEHQKEGQRH